MSTSTDRKPWVELKVIADKDGASVSYLAEKSGFSERYIYDLLAGTRRPTPRAIKALAKALNVPKSMLEPRVAA